MYAVIEIKGHQYIVQEWMDIEIDKIESEKDFVDCVDVLCFFDNNWNINIWKPKLDAVVNLAIKSNFKWEKVNIIKFRRKNRYKRKIWFRPLRTVLEVKSIKINE